VEINQYIKDQLLLNDCVIIPEFGGFVANYKPATIENNQFFPPTKEIAFNNKLISNDGLLINYIAETEGVSYFRAKQKLENFVEETLQMLERNRNVYFEGVGYLHYDSHENLLFEPQLKQNLLIDSYGLQNFSYEKLYQRQMPKPAFKIEHQDAMPAIFEKRKLKKLIVAVPLLIALALIPIKHNKEYLSKSDMGMWEALIQNTPAVSIQPTEQNTAEYIANSTIPEPKQNKYYIIGGSFRSEENANKFILQLKEQGYNGLNLGVFNGLNRIAMEGFATMEDAQKELNALLYKNPKSGVWIHVN
jgi:nucleoid DNA-binding protein